MHRLISFAALAGAACGSSRAPAPPGAGPVAGPAGVVASNVLRADYAGSEACADCHADEYAKWAASPMRNMTRDAATAAIRAPFDGASLRVGTDVATMVTVGGARELRVARPDGVERFRITKVVGGRYREDFVGVDVRGGPERVLPATYVFSTSSWRYKGYSVMVKERPAMSTRGVWSRECIPCHNTLPLVTTYYDELYGQGAPPYQGKLSDRLLPRARLWDVRARDGAKLAGVLADEIRFLGAEPPAGATLRELLPAAAVASEAHLGGDKLVELGIGCEACHNGARAHAADPDVRPSYAARSDVVEVVPPGGTASRAAWINHACAKCHTVLFSRYPWTWEGGTRRGDPGGSTTNSGEGRDFKLGGCATALACTGCHDPHAADAPEAMARLATPAGNATCAPCHADIAADVARHSHHAPASAGSSCVGCHMPKKNMGLGYDLVRYHRIGSPNDPARVAGDRPLECALCHADRSVEALAATMDAWWPRRPADRAALRRLYGDDLSVNAITATLVRGKPHEQAVAIAVLGEARARAAIPHLAPHLAHEYPLIRYYAHHALERITGVPVPIDVNEPAAQIRAAVERWLAAIPR